MIPTVTEVKSFLNISGSTYDTRISNYIRPVMDFIINKCHNYFERATDTIYLNSTTISFENASPPKIYDSASLIVDSGFLDGMQIRVNGSAYNDGIYQVDTVAAGVFTLASDETLTDEDLTYLVTITCVLIPKGVKMACAFIIGELLKYEALTDKVQSERVGNVSYTYANLVAGEIPDGIIKMLKPYIRVNFI